MCTPKQKERVHGLAITGNNMLYYEKQFTLLQIMSQKRTCRIHVPFDRGNKVNYAPEETNTNAHERKTETRARVCFFFTCRALSVFLNMHVIFSSLAEFRPGAPLR